MSAARSAPSASSGSSGTAMPRSEASRALPIHSRSPATTAEAPSPGCPSAPVAGGMTSPFRSASFASASATG